jgi:phasin
MSDRIGLELQAPFGGLLSPPPTEAGMPALPVFKPKADIAPMAGFIPEMPKFALPNFDFPKMEVPAVFRDMAEKSVAQAKDNYEKLKSVAEEATDVLENTYTKASRGMSDYGLKMIETARTNANANFDYFAEVLGVKTMAEFVELSTAHARRQFDAFSAQSKELSSFAQKVATDTAEPIKGSVSKVFSKAA